MINNQAALQINNALLNNMGVFGSTIRAEPSMSIAAVQEKAKKEYQLSTKLLYGMTDYLVRVDASLKKQTNATRTNYNRQLMAVRETATEDKKQPDAVPVAANDNNVDEGDEQQGGLLGLLATGLVVGGAALLISKFEVISKAISGIIGTVGSALSAVGSVLGLDPGPEPVEPTQTQPETNIPDDKEYTPPTAGPGPRQQPKPKPSRPQRPSGPSQSTPSTASPPSARSSSSQPATPVTKPPMTTSPPRAGAKPPAAAPKQVSPAGKPSIASGEIPRNNIVALGNYLIGKGAERGKMEHPAFGSVGKHTKNSRHYRGQAIDVNFPGPNEGAILDALEPQLNAAGYFTLWRKPGHMTHMHVSVGGPEGSKAGAGGGGGMLAAAGEAVSEAVDNTLESLATKFARLKPTNVMTKLIGEEALARQNDLLNAKATPGQKQGASSKRSRKAAPPSPVQSSVRRTSENVIGQYLFMFLDQKLETGNPKAIVQA